MDLAKRLDRLSTAHNAEVKRRRSAEKKAYALQKELDTVKANLNTKEPVDVLTTIVAIHELRKTNRKLDIYHVGMLAYALQVGKFTSTQFRNKTNSGKNKFYETMSEMRDWGYIDITETNYKRRRVWFHLTTKGQAIADRLNENIVKAKVNSRRERLKNG
jgi:hypothetical protein